MPDVARLAMAKRFGVNEAAAPRVGEAFAIFSTRPEPLPQVTPEQKARLR